MLRNQLQILSDWYAKGTARKPIILRGARQVGKSTLVRLFAQEQGLTLIEVNLEKHPHLDAVFKTLDVNKILRSLEAVTKSSNWTRDRSLIFLDEIQGTPNAIAALRYLYEERPEIPVIAAGSLLEFVLNEHDFSMPVGRIQYLHIGPMTFEEFLLASTETYFLKSLQEFTLEDALPDESHRRLSELHHLYCFIGGMPEVISTYIRTKSLRDVRLVQQSICDTYKDDFSKYGLHQDILRLHQVFDWAAQNVGKKVKYSEVLPDEQSKTTRRLLNLLSYSKVITPVVHSHANGLPLNAEAESKTFKLNFLDVGLMNSILDTPWSEYSQENITRAIHGGVIAEQYIGQELQSILRSAGTDQLYYWLRERASINAEVDYLFPWRGTIVPIEVKSGKKGTLRSLLEFTKHRNPNIVLRFDSNPATIQGFLEGKSPVRLLSLPHYASGQTARLLLQCTS